LIEKSNSNFKIIQSKTPDILPGFRAPLMAYSHLPLAAAALAIEGIGAQTSAGN
jgi:hypothetical protein